MKLLILLILSMNPIFSESIVDKAKRQVRKIGDGFRRFTSGKKGRIPAVKERIKRKVLDKYRGYKKRREHIGHKESYQQLIDGNERAGEQEKTYDQSIVHKKQSIEKMSDEKSRNESELSIIEEEILELKTLVSGQRHSATQTASALNDEETDEQSDLTSHRVLSEEYQRNIARQKALEEKGDKLRARNADIPALILRAQGKVKEFTRLRDEARTRKVGYQTRKESMEKSDPYYKIKLELRKSSGVYHKLAIKEKRTPLEQNLMDIILGAHFYENIHLRKGRSHLMSSEKIKKFEKFFMEFVSQDHSLQRSESSDLTQTMNIRDFADYLRRFNLNENNLSGYTSDLLDLVFNFIAKTNLDGPSLETSSLGLVSRANTAPSSPVQTVGQKPSHTNSTGRFRAQPRLYGSGNTSGVSPLGTDGVSHWQRGSGSSSSATSVNQRRRTSESRLSTRRHQRPPTPLDGSLRRTRSH